MISESHHLLEPSFRSVNDYRGRLIYKGQEVSSINIFNNHCKICCVSHASFSENLDASMWLSFRFIHSSPRISDFSSSRSVAEVSVKKVVCACIQKCVIFMVNGHQRIPNWKFQKKCSFGQWKTIAIVKFARAIAVRVRSALVQMVCSG